MSGFLWEKSLPQLREPKVASFHHPMYSYTHSNKHLNVSLILEHLNGTTANGKTPESERDWTVQELMDDRQELKDRTIGVQPSLIGVFPRSLAGAKKDRR